MANSKNFVIKNGLEVGGQLIVSANGDIGFPAESNTNSATATKLKTAREIALTGGVSGAATFDGSANISISTTITVGDGTLTLATSGIATGSQTFSANQTSNATFTVDVPATNIAEGTRTANTVTITSSTGSNAVLNSANSTQAGVMSSTDKSKLDGIAAGAEVNVDTNLSTTANTISRTVASSTGTDVVLPSANSTQAGVMSSSDKDKLDGIAAGAEVNTVTSVATKTGAVTLEKSDVGLGNVDNTSDVNKPVSTATQTALNLKANLASPTLTGVPAAPTANTGTNTTQIATTAFVQGAVSGLVDAAPATLDTLNELAAALGDDPNFATTVSNSIGGKAPLTGEGTSGTWGISITGSAATLATGRTIALTGDVTYTSGGFDGSANVTGTATLANSGVDAGSYGGSTAIPVLTIDAKGRVTAASTNSISVGDGTLTLATSGIATGSQTFSANQTSNATFTVDVPGTNIDEGTRTANTVTITSSTGSNAVLNSANTSVSGVMSSADKTKLDGIATGAQTGTVTSVSGGDGLSGTVTTSGSLAVDSTVIRTSGDQTKAGILTLSNNAIFTASVRIGGNTAPLESLDVVGNILATGDITAFSDSGLKENVEVLTDAIDKVHKIRGVTFTRNDHEDKQKRHSGVIAQEVEQVLPEVVTTHENGIKSVAYGNMIGLLIEAIKEQQIHIQKLEEKISTL